MQEAAKLIALAIVTVGLAVVAEAYDSGAAATFAGMFGAHLLFAIIS